MSAIVIGGGTNGLAAAARLARDGRKVVLLEARRILGGIAAGIEFHPGFRSAGLLDSAALDGVVGLRGAPAVAPVAIFAGGRTVRRAGEDGLATWLAAHRAFLGTLLVEPAPRIDPGAPLAPLLRLGMALRRGGVPRMREAMRVPLLAAEDWLTELGIPDEVRGLLEAPALLGGVVGPRQPTTAGLVLLDGIRGAARISGPAAITALEAMARGAGVEVRLGARVARIRTAAGAVIGVTLADGTAIDAPIVLSALDPRLTLLELLDPWEAGTSLRRTAVAMRGRGAVAQLLVAASAPPAVVSAWLDPTPRRLEQGYDRRKYGTFDVTDPAPLHLTVPSADAPALAPAGSAVVSVRWTAAPTEGWTEETRERASDAMIAAVERCLPGFAASVVARRLVTPADLRAELGASHPFHLEHAFDQLWAGRPAFGLGHYATPLRGLYLGSAGVHPGGGVAGTPGWLAAGAVR